MGKGITFMGGLPQHGIAQEDLAIFKRCELGPKKRLITLAKSLVPQTSREALEQVNMKFVDTSGK